jgi:hypothetical protein
MHFNSSKPYTLHIPSSRPLPARRQTKKRAGDDERKRKYERKMPFPGLRGAQIPVGTEIQKKKRQSSHFKCVEYFVPPITVAGDYD